MKEQWKKEERYDRNEDVIEAQPPYKDGVELANRTTKIDERSMETYRRTV